MNLREDHFAMFTITEEIVCSLIYGCRYLVMDLIVSLDGTVCFQAVVYVVMEIILTLDATV